ncbi:MAG: YbjQ family protein [Acidimicrobiales bacterium]
MSDPSAPPPGGGAPVDLRAEMLRAAQCLEHPAKLGSPSTTSGLSIDEELVLHSVGWEPVELVNGVSIYSVPVGVWNWGQGEITFASTAHLQAFAAAIKRIHAQCTNVGGHGVVGVRVERSISRHHITVELTGTAVRPVAAKTQTGAPVFVSDLPAKDFALLLTAGWQPLGLAYGASFIYAPRRSAGTALQQKNQNVELTTFTEAMYSARELAMQRMQEVAIALKGSGVVDVTVTEGPMHFAHHAIGFTTWGTVVRMSADRHRHIEPMPVVALDDVASAFDADALRGA